VIRHPNTVFRDYSIGCNGVKWFTYTRLPISVIGTLFFLALELPQKYHILYTQDFNKEFENAFRICCRKVGLKERQNSLGSLNKPHS